MKYNIAAVYKYPDTGYRPAQNLIVGNAYKVTGIYMGSSSTTITLYGFQNEFNSVQFDFFEDGKPLDIYSDARFNPWLRR